MSYDDITALELDESPLPVAEEELVEARLAEHYDNPDSSVPLQDPRTVCAHDKIVAAQR